MRWNKSPTSVFFLVLGQPPISLYSCSRFSFLLSFVMSTAGQVLHQAPLVVIVIGPMLTFVTVNRLSSAVLLSRGKLASLCVRV